LRSNARTNATQIIIFTVIIALLLFLFVAAEDVVFGENPLTNNSPATASISLTRGSLTATVASLGYYGVFGLMIIDATSLPIPSEAVLLFSGYLISIGQLNFLLTVTIATVATLVGSLISYYIGLKGIETLTKKKIFGRILFSANNLTLARKWFDKYGSSMIFLARLVPGIRTLISFPAGAVRMPLTKFVIFTTAGCLLWNSVIIYIGYYLGGNWTQIAADPHYVLISVIAATLLLILFYLYLRKRKNRSVALVLCTKTNNQN
jgi:membrane protein DedA with SNARE-associated domain